jgi:hypothetical protein
MASQEKSSKVSRRTPMKHTRVSKFICGFKPILSVLLGRTRLHPKQEVEAPEKELWIIKYEHNLNNSPIYRLPNELILMVMTLLPLESLHLSRQAGHRFMVVFARPEFAHLHRGNHMRMNHACSREVKALLQKDAFCQPCQAAIMAGDSGRGWTRLRQPLYCGGCKRHHPTILFSVGQRWNTDEQRVCIGREGHVRVCQHKTLSWSDVAEALKRM